MQSTLQTAEAFGALPLKSEGDAVVRLRDVARVELASEEQEEIVTFNGQPGTFIGVFPTPAANPLDTADAVIAELPAINATLPEGMEIEPRLRLDRDDQRLDRGGVQDDRRGGGDRGAS